jgi:hypothetical protein
MGQMVCPNIEHPAERLTKCLVLSLRVSKDQFYSASFICVLALRSVNAWACLSLGSFACVDLCRENIQGGSIRPKWC